MIIAATVVAWKAVIGLALIVNHDMRRKQPSYSK